MEGNNTVSTPPDPYNAKAFIAAEMGISSTDAGTIAGMSGLLKDMDVNGDGQLPNGLTYPIGAGNVVAILRPTATLPTTGSTSIGEIPAEHAYTQEAITTYTYNQYGQRTSVTDAEQNVSVYLYYPETAPFDGTTSSEWNEYLDRGLPARC
jgi:YD repeat-containing protein